MPAPMPYVATPGKRPRLPEMALVALLCAAASLWRGLQYPVNDDDIYHLHSIWLTAHGHVPYRGFFEIHLPGMWLLLAPLAWITRSGTALFLAGRFTVALLFGGMVLLGGRIVRATGAHAILLGLAAVLALGACQAWVFRAEFVAAFLVMLHCWILSRADDGRMPARDVFLAAAVISLACTMSVRPLLFLLVQPALIAAEWLRVRVRPKLLPFLAGLLAGALPAAVFLAAHGLWRDAFYWSFRFVSSGGVVQWQARIDPRRAPFLVLGLACIALVQFERRLPRPTRLLLALAWLLAFGFDLVNPLKMPFARIHLLLLTGVLTTQALFTLVDLLARRGRTRVAAALAVAAIVATLGLVAHYRSLPLAFDRRMQHEQLVVLDWLQRVSDGAPVVLVAPYHPVVVPDATDIENAWHYSYWIAGAPVSRRLQGFSEAVLRQRPPVISADPWPRITRGKGLLDWLGANGVDSPARLDAVRSLIAREYVEVAFPALGTLPYGTAFWVRRDRLGPSRVPANAVVKPD